MPGSRQVSKGMVAPCEFVVKEMLWHQFVLREFQPLRGLSGTGRVRTDRIMSEGRCRDLDDFSRRRLWGKQLSGPML